MICSTKLVREVNAKGDTVWEFKPDDVPDYKITGFQIAIRLPNGNTLIGNWPKDTTNVPLQALKITPAKQVVWALRAVKNPDLGRFHHDSAVRS
ncbi:MAG: hypothetical protein JWP63_6119 [Candidatus Solibacter sp.]|nr:hypothetical protein [Candidatus Solibacter sp.]